jgi:hypothetical protein
MQRAPCDNIVSRRQPMRKVREKSASTFVKVAGNACATGISLILTIDELHLHHATPTHHDASTARCADSESRFLAMKKFSCGSHRGRIAARQNQFFERIAAADSQRDFGRAMRHYGTLARAQIRRDGLLAGSRVSQMPSLLFSRSLTDCGLALPAEDFIT